MPFTIGQAARETGKSTSTISKAVKNGTMSAEKQPDGSYQIDAAELFKVFPRKGAELAEAHGGAHGITARESGIESQT